MDAVENKLCPKKKMPWDARIVGWFTVAYSAVILLLAMTLLTGIGKTDPSGGMPACFGLITLHTDVQSGVNALIGGLGLLLSGYGLIKGYRFSWWLRIVLILNVIPTCVHHVRHFPAYRSWIFFWLCLDIGTFGWLLFRARLYRPFKGTG